MVEFVHFLPWLWVAITLICIIIEVFSFSLTTIWFACGALITTLFSLTKMPFYWQLLIFVLSSLILLLCTRPFVVKKLRIKRVATNSDAIIGKTALVTQTVSAQKKGTIKVGGLEWTAKCAEDDEIQEGCECTVCAIEGVTAVVKKRDLL